MNGSVCPHVHPKYGRCIMSSRGHAYAHVHTARFNGLLVSWNQSNVPTREGMDGETMYTIRELAVRLASYLDTSGELNVLDLVNRTLVEVGSHYQVSDVRQEKPK